VGGIVTPKGKKNLLGVHIEQADFSRWIALSPRCVYRRFGRVQSAMVVGQRAIRKCPNYFRVADHSPTVVGSATCRWTAKALLAQGRAVCEIKRVFLKPLMNGYDGSRDAQKARNPLHFRKITSNMVSKSV
jgi:hypothetical protein